MVVLALVMVDLVILVVYTIVEGDMGDLEAERVVSEENTSDTVGVSHRNSIYTQPCNLPACNLSGVIVVPGFPQT